MMMKFSIGLILAMLLTTGCERAPDPVAYHGAVTLDGQPLATGRIQLITKGEPPEAAEIIDGKFKGVALPGTKYVEIYAFRPTEASPDALIQYPELGAPIENYLPDEYNTASTLTQEIVADGPNQLRFDLTSH